MNPSVVQPALLQESARLSDDELAELVWQEIQGTGRVIAQVRLPLMLVASTFVFVLLAIEYPSWRLWPFIVALGLVAIVLVRDVVWVRHRQIRRHHLGYFLAPVVVLHTVIILVTGGAESPFLVLYVAIGMVPAVTFGRIRPYLAWAAVPLLLLWFFAIGAVTGWLPDLKPSFLGAYTGFGSSALYTYTQAAIFSVALLLGGAIILAVRAAVERTVRHVAEMRAEIIETMRERHRELLLLSGELAHELKNPLASVQGLSTLIDRKLPSDSKEKEHMAVLIAEVRRMGGTLDQFLNFSRPVTGLATRMVDPAELLREVVKLHEGMAYQRGQRLVQPPGVAVEPLSCDPRKVKQALANLIQNALDASEPGGQISLVVQPGPDRSVTWLVEDAGHGIAPQIRASLFQPGTTTKREGSGLGLTIARAIAEQHGGTLQLEDREPRGCRARLTLPAEPVAVGSHPPPATHTTDRESTGAP